mgnify:CR=1 FL=1
MDNINLNLNDSQKFIKEYHRHSEPLKRHMFSIGAVEYPGSIALLGIITIDRCSSAWSKRRDHIEIRRLCIKPNAPKNTASFLISKAKDACWAMGYKCIITYTKPYESGSSLLATGFYIQKAKWGKENIQHPKGLVQWCVSQCSQNNPKNREQTKKVLKKFIEV